VDEFGGDLADDADAQKLFIGPGKNQLEQARCIAGPTMKLAPSTWGSVESKFPPARSISTPGQASWQRKCYRKGGVAVAIISVSSLSQL
jgi:hypothetical protein